MHPSLALTRVLRLPEGLRLGTRETQGAYAVWEACGRSVARQGLTEETMATIVPHMLAKFLLFQCLIFSEVFPWLLRVILKTLNWSCRGSHWEGHTID